MKSPATIIITIKAGLLQGFVGLGVFALLSSGCAHHSSDKTRKVQTSYQTKFKKFVHFPRQTLVFEPSRDDFTVGKVVFGFYCAEPDAVRINGVKPDPEWSEIHLSKNGIEVDRRIQTDRDRAWLYIHLPQIGRNQVELAPLRIEVLPGHQGLLCMSLKAWFNEVPNMYDSMFYQDTDDRYALVSYCTQSGNYPSDVNARFGMNQDAGVKEFKDFLANPIRIKLNDREIKDEWRSK